MNIEKKAFEYGKARKRVEKLYPGCKVKVNENAGIYIENAEGRNILAQKLVIGIRSRLETRRSSVMT